MELCQEMVFHKTPIADRLIELKNKIRHSFHALPIFKGNSLFGCDLLAKYKAIFGEQMLDTEMTATGKSFDSFFFPNSVIRESEDLSSRLFGADGTIYVTTGTTTSNQIAIGALYNKQGPVLVDKNCHQSIHFTCNMLGATVHYLSSAFHCETTERAAWNVETLRDIALLAQSRGTPYELIVLTAQSYDGVVYDIPGVIRYLLDHGVVTRKFLIDEAWGGANYFNPQLRRLTAMNLDEVLAVYPDLELVCTQSAHKALSCLRQASMIHFRGSRGLRERLEVSKFRTHSTSPSYPILASLDLAQAQMAASGTARVAQSIALAQSFISQVKDDPALSCFRINAAPKFDVSQDFLVMDPTKVSLNIKGTGMSAAEVKDFLHDEYGIYVNRITTHSILLNFHIGVTEEALDDILDALRKLQGRQVAESIQKVVSDCFLIPYPPGVPLVVPGETITDDVIDKINKIRQSGIRVISA